MKAAIFDLDYTLYDTEQYYLGAFKKISEKYSASKFVEKKMFLFLVTTWRKKTSMYPHLFDDFSIEFKLKNKTKELVEDFNGYKGNLKPYPEVTKILTKLNKNKIKMGIITDGNIQRQKRKINLLGIKNFFNKIIFVQESGFKKKESPLFFLISKKLGVSPMDCVYVGDNPLLDFFGAKKAGMKTFRVKRGEFKKIDSGVDVDLEANNLGKLIDLIK